MEGAHDEDELDNEEWALFEDKKTAKCTAAAQTSDLLTWWKPWPVNGGIADFVQTPGSWPVSAKGTCFGVTSRKTGVTSRRI